MANDAMFHGFKVKYPCHFLAAGVEIVQNGAGQAEKSVNMGCKIDLADDSVIYNIICEVRLEYIKRGIRTFPGL